MSGLRYLLLLLIACSSVCAEEGDSDKKTEEDERKKEATLEKKREEEALIRAQFNYSFDEIRDRLVTIQFKQGAGAGFIAEMDGKSYLFMNQHILLGAEQLRFTTVSGKKLRPRKIELSTTRDIARLLLPEGTEGFSITADMPMDSPVGVFGSSAPDPAKKGLYGTVVGLGAEIVEISSDFEKENSGSPVLNLNQEVLGMASHVRTSRPGAGKTGTRFENKVRRFCYRLTGNEWKPVNWKKYNAHYGEFYRKNTQFTEGIIEILVNWDNSPNAVVRVTEHPEKSLLSWAESHNQIMVKQGGSNQKKRFASAYSASLMDLSESCRSRSRQIRLFLKQRDLTEYLREELDQQAYTLEYIAEIFVLGSTRSLDYR